MEKQKPVFLSELAYVFGLILVAVSGALLERANFGVSMVVAPAYVLYRWLNPTFSWVTFGMATYTVQAVLILAMSLVLRRFRLFYLFSFVTAVVFGFMLDGAVVLASFLPDDLWWRILYYVVGVVVCSAGISMMFHTYFAPEAYELFVKEISTRYRLNINKTKMVYDVVSCAVAALIGLLVFLFTDLGEFVGVGVGTVLCAIVNGYIIGLFSKLFERIWRFEDALPLRDFFTTDRPEKK